MIAEYGDAGREYYANTEMITDVRTIIEKGDTTVTDYIKNLSFIKIINDSHFAFLKHDLSKGKGESKDFDAGGGTYTLKDSLYTERLEYYKQKEWEGGNFHLLLPSKTILSRKGASKK